MARKTASRLEKRRELEAAEKLEKPKKKTTKKKAASTTVKKKTTRKTKRTKASAAERRRLVWAIYNGNMKEEARFPYENRQEAEEKLAQLRAKGKRFYFIQPLKEPITDTPSEASE